MSEEKKPEEVVEEVVEETPAEPEAKPEKEKRGGGGGGGLAALALLVSLGVAGGGAYLWQELSTAQSRLLAANAELRQAMEALRAADREQQTALSERLTAQAQSEAQRREALRGELQAALTALHEELGRDRDGWVRYEVEYLLAYANRRLQLDGDIRSADAALEAADERLLAQADPALLPVRQAIAAERRALAALPRIDTEGMVLELAALAEGIEALPLPGAPQRFQPEAESPTAGDEAIDWKDWRGLGNALWSDLGELVTVRTGRDQPLPLTSPEQRFFLQQNLRLKLLAARMALLQGEQVVFRAALTEADAWLGQYFDTEAAAVSAARATLRRLAAVEQAPALPDISTSLRRLRALAPGIFEGEAD